MRNRRVKNIFELNTFATKNWLHLFYFNFKDCLVLIHYTLVCPLYAKCMMATRVITEINTH